MREIHGQHLPLEVLMSATGTPPFPVRVPTPETMTGPDILLENYKRAQNFAGKPGGFGTLLLYTLERADGVLITSDLDRQCDPVNQTLLQRLYGAVGADTDRPHVYEKNSDGFYRSEVTYTSPLGVAFTEMYSSTESGSWQSFRVTVQPAAAERPPQPKSRVRAAGEKLLSLFKGSN